MSRRYSSCLAFDLAEHALDQHFREADDRVQRRPQLVRHVREELRLVLAGDLELAALVLDLVEQPHVLDRDHGLVGEGLYQLDLLLGERPHFFPAHQDAAERLSFPQQRHRERRPVPEQLLWHTRLGKFVEGGREVRDMHDRRIDDRTAYNQAPRQGKDGPGARQIAESHDVPQGIRLHQVQAGVRRVAQLRRAVRNRFKNRHHVSGRAADDAQDLGGRGLLFQRFGDFGVTRLELLEQPHVLDRDHRLVGESFEQLDLAVRKRADLHAGESRSCRWVVPRAAAV